MRPIDGDELLEHVWRARLDSRERIADLVESMPTIEPRRIEKMTIEQPLKWKDQKPIEHEKYRLIFTHEYVDEKGEPYRVDEPIIAEYIIPRIDGHMHCGVVVNELVEMLARYIRQKVEAETCG